MRKFALLFLAVGLASCMTMTRGRSQTIEVQTRPPGARVTVRPVRGDLVSPASVTLRRKPGSTINVSIPDARHEHVSYLVTASRPGYKVASVAIESKVASGTWTRNLIWLHPVCWGIGVGVDLSTGAGYELTPSDILIEMEPVQQDHQTDHDVSPPATIGLAPGSR